MCSILNDYFSNIFTVKDLSLFSLIKNREGSYPYPINQGRRDYLYVDITEENVLHTIGGLKVNKAGGVSGWNSSYLMELAEVIALPLTLIFRKSVATGEIQKIVNYIREAWH